MHVGSHKCMKTQSDRISASQLQYFPKVLRIREKANGKINGTQSRKNTQAFRGATLKSNRFSTCLAVS